MSDPVFTVYKTTNLINGKIYIGVHKTRVPRDNYLGSGKLVSRAVQKYGRDAFKKEVLFIFDTKAEAYAKEKELVHDTFVKRADTYNLMVGGVVGGWYDNHKGEKNSQHGTVWVTNGCVEEKVSRGEELLPGWRRGRMPHDSYTGPPSGKNNPIHGWPWVHKKGEERRTSPTELASRVPEGWEPGRIPSGPRPEAVRIKIGDALRGRMWVHKGGRKTQISPSDLDSYQARGWTVGMGPRT